MSSIDIVGGRVSARTHSGQALSTGRCMLSEQQWAGRFARPIHSPLPWRPSAGLAGGLVLLKVDHRPIDSACSLAGRCRSHRYFVGAKSGAGPRRIAVGVLRARGRVYRSYIPVARLGSDIQEQVPPTIRVRRVGYCTPAARPHRDGHAGQLGVRSRVDGPLDPR